MEGKKRLLANCILLLAVPAVILLGVIAFKDRQYAWISLCIAVFSCFAVLLAVDRRSAATGELIIIAVMVAITVVSRIIFAPIPGFKPVTAIVVITAMYFGPRCGFMTGALAAALSNFYFGQGPWTPFQMFVWGIIGFLAGLLSKKLKTGRVWLIVYGIFSGVLFSVFMDVWTVLWWDGSFNVKRYVAAIISALGFTAVYAVSNVVFLLLLRGPIGGKLERIKEKYGL